MAQKDGDDPGERSDDGDTCDESSPHLCIPATKAPAQEEAPSDDSRDFTISISKYRISICKPLVPLKLSLFVYYGAGSFMVSFLTLLYKQRGVTLPQLSTMSMASPIFQFLGSTLSGITADRLGRTRPVLVVNLLIILSAVIGFLVLPEMHSDKIHLTCSSGSAVTLTANGALEEGAFQVQSCLGHCPEEATTGECPDCRKFGEDLLLHVNGTFLEKVNGSYRYHAVSVDRGAAKRTGNSSWCSGESRHDCTLTCTARTGTDGWLLGAYAALFMLVLTTHSNCYRCLDVTCMVLADAHGSTFGRERVFAMLGPVLVSPLAGYLADASTPIGGRRNYLSPFYLYMGMNLFLLPVISQLPVHANTPGRKMWKKSVQLLRSPDVLSFLAVILVLGTAWNFRKLFLFWHLEGLGASSLLMGLVTSVSALYGLPFLYTSHWWIAKLGSTGIFVAALLAHAANAIGYALMRDPWVALALEVTDTVAYFVLWVAVVEYSHRIAPAGLTATVIATSGAVHFTAGKVSAGLMGRFIMHLFGGRSAFGFSALMTLTASILYAFYLCFRNKTKHTDAQKTPRRVYLHSSDGELLQQIQLTVERQTNQGRRFPRQINSTS